MKNYGMKVKTEYSKADVDALVNTLKMEKWVASKLYKYAGYFGYNDGNMAGEAEQLFNRISKGGQAALDSYAKIYGEEWYDHSIAEVEVKEVRDANMITERQESYLKSLVAKKGADLTDEQIAKMTKQEASEWIGKLK